MAVDQSIIETSARGALGRGGAGLVAALVSALTFATSGSFAHALLVQGWTPGAVVTCRLGLASAFLLVPAIRALRGRWWTVRRHAVSIIAYGLIGVAGCQLFFYSAVERVPVGMALLLEYTSPLLIVLGAWALTRRPPGRLTMLGGGIALVGLLLVIDVFGSLRLDGLGVLFGFAAAVCNAGHFVIAARQHEDLPPLVLATGGLVVGALVLGTTAALGLLPFRATAAPVLLGQSTVPWWLPLLGVSLVAASLAYVLGIIGSRQLGPTVASFIGLSEVVFAVLWAWLLIGQKPLPQQLFGGAVILAGVVLIKVDDLARRPPSAVVRS